MKTYALLNSKRVMEVVGRTPTHYKLHPLRNPKEHLQQDLIVAVANPLVKAISNNIFELCE